MFLHLGLPSSSSSQDPCPEESLAVQLENLWFLCRLAGTGRFLASCGHEPSVVGTSWHPAGAMLLRAKGTVPALDLSTVNQVPRAGPPLQASGCLSTADRVWRTGPRAQRAPARAGTSSGLIGSSRGRRWAALQSGGKVVEGTGPGSLLQSLLPQVPAAHGALLPCIRGPVCPFSRPNAKKSFFESRKGNNPFSFGTWLLSDSPRKCPWDRRQSESPASGKVGKNSQAKNRDRQQPETVLSRHLLFGSLTA